MEIIKKTEFDTAENKPLIKTINQASDILEKEITPKEIQELNNPVNKLKKLSILLEEYTDYRMRQEINNLGSITEETRKILNLQKDLLVELQKSQHGTKSQHLHLHDISHNAIAAKIRQHKKKVLDVKPSEGEMTNE